MPVLESISHSALARKAHGMAAAGAHYKRALGVLQREVEALLAPSHDPFEQFDTTKAKERIRRAFAKAGMDPEDRALTDARLRLLLDTTRQSVEGEAHYQAGLAQAGEAPAWELYRREDREEPRDWATRWAEACDEAGDEEAAAAFENHGRMVAHKRSGVWQALGDGAGGYSDTLGKPYPPFAFNSGMWTREVSKGRTRKMGFANTTPAEVESAAAQTDANPSQAQKEAGNYAKGKVTVHGLEISIENPKGGVRSGVGKDGEEWQVTMPAHYGCIVSFSPSQKLTQGSVANTDIFRNRPNTVSASKFGSYEAQVIDMLIAAVPPCDSALAEGFHDGAICDSAMSSNGSDVKAAVQEINGFLDVPFKVSSGCVNAHLLKAAAYYLAINAKLFGDISNGCALRSKGFGSLAVQRQFAVELAMQTCVKNLQIAQCIVKLVPITMMDMAPFGNRDSSIINGSAIAAHTFSVAFNHAVLALKASVINKLAACLPRAFALWVAEKVAAFSDAGAVPVKSGPTKSTFNNHSTKFSCGAPKSKDGDHVDCYIGDNPESERVFVVDQLNADTGAFDEHKVLLGFDSEQQARDIYLSGFSDGKGAQRLGAITEVPVTAFKYWLRRGNTKKPFAECSIAAEVANAFDEFKHPRDRGQFARNGSKDYGLTPFSGRLGKRGYHKSTQSGVALSAKVNPSSVELLRMDVQEQGRGIGGAVLEKLKQFAKDTNRKLWLNARADTPELQPRLRAFYERHGMKPVGNDEYEWNSEVV